MIKRVKHSKAELEAIKQLDRIACYVTNEDGRALLTAAGIALRFYYESDRARVLRETWNVLRNL